MRKFFRCFGFIFLFCLMLCNGRVRAYDVEKVKLDDAIYFPMFVFGNTIDISLYDDYKDNNSFIYYQFVSITKEQNDSFNQGFDSADKNLSACKTKAKNDYDYDKIKDALVAEGKTYLNDKEYIEVYNKYSDAYNACVKSYRSEINSVESQIPSFDDSKWIKQNITNEDEAEYSIKFPSDINYFVLWVKAKDADNNDIYNHVFLENSSYESNEPKEEAKPEDSKDEVKDESKEEAKPEDSKEEIKDNSKEEIKDNSKEEAKPEDSKDEVKDESKEETKVENNKENKEETKKEEVKNPETGVYGVYGFGLLCIVLLIVLKKKSSFSKI